MEFTITTTFKVAPKEVYTAWLSSKEHSEMTGGEAIVTDKVGEKFTTWDDYITGTNLVLEPYKRIVQSWRTTEFESEEEDSKIEILLKEIDGKTELTLKHTNLFQSEERYKKGWIAHYFEPMQTYFNNQ